MPSSVSLTPRSPTSGGTDEDDPARPPSAPPRPPAPPCTAHDAHRDAALGAACRNAVTPAPNDRILYVGLNDESAAAEGRTLAARGVGVDRVEAEASTTIAFRGVEHDLSKEAGTRAFAAAVAEAYGLDAAHAGLLATVLVGVSAQGRDELARVALQWAPAEAGAAVASRLVLSGHSSGGLVWGRTSMLEYESFRALAQALPKAATQIEDIHISACFTEREVKDVALWAAAFPNLRTLWAYRGFAPATPVVHLADWELATRGRTSRLGEALARSHPPVTAWSINGGVVNSGLPIEERRALVTEAEGRFAAYFSGSRRIAHGHQPDADGDYGAYQMLGAHRDTTPAERALANTRVGQLLRLRFYEQSVRGEFATKHGATIGLALTRVGLPPADFARLSRRDALGVIDAFQQRTAGTTDRELARVAALLTGLEELRADVVPERWCH